MDGAEAGEGGTRSILRSYVRSQALAGDRARREKRPAARLSAQLLKPVPQLTHRLSDLVALSCRL